MLLPPSKRNAPVPERPQVAPLWLILLLAGLVGSALWVLYPRDDLEERLKNSFSNPDLTESYIRNLLRGEPDNAQLQDMLQRIEKAKALRQRNAGSASSASAAIATEEKSSSNAWTVWEESYQRYQQVPTTDASLRQEKKNVSLQLMHQVQWEALDETQLLYAAQAALVLGDSAQAKHAFGLLIQRTGSTEESLQVMEVAAKSALGQGMYTAASEWYMQASKTAVATEQKKIYTLGAVAVLQAGNRLNEALSLARTELKAFDNDPVVLRKLIDIARAAGKPDIAQAYAKQLLKLSWLKSNPFYHDDSEPVQVTRFFWDHEPPPRHSASKTVANKAGPQLPFDDKTYELGYTVFLENQNSEDAWRVAKAAVQQVPNNLTWRRRLADVSEWTHRPAEALEQWHYIARNTNEHAAWMHVLRLAPGQLDDQALVEGLEYQLRHSPGNQRLLQEVIDVHERLGQPDKAATLLKPLTSGNPVYGEMLAELYERMGQDELALQQWQQILSRDANLTHHRALKAATLALKLGQGDQGLKWLSASSQMPSLNEEEKMDFLRLHAEVADLQNSAVEAEIAYGALLKTDSASAAEFDAFIALLRQQGRISEAAAVAKHAWNRFQDMRHLQQAMLLYEVDKDWGSFGRLIGELQANDGLKKIQSLQQDAYFYSLLGNYYQATQQYDHARTTYRAGLQNFPNSPELQQAMLWFAIDSNDISTLRMLVQRFEPIWKNDETLHDALAAAYQALSLPHVSVHQYLKPRLPQHRNDFLWMMAYADALEQNQQPEEAWQIRRTLLNEQLRQRTSSNEKLANWIAGAEGEAARNFARGRLLMSQAPGDPATAVLREILRMDTGNKAAPDFSDAAFDTLLGWYLDKAQYSAARRHLWEKYARSRSKNTKLWAEIAIALSEVDRPLTGQLLERHGEALTRYDKVSAATLVGDIRLAQTEAFNISEHQPLDDALHQQLEESLLSFSDHAGVQFSNRRLNELSEKTSEANFHWALSPRWSLDFKTHKTRRSTRDIDALRLPSNEKGIDFSLNWKGQESNGTLRTGRRESLATYHPLDLHWEQSAGNRLRWRVQAGKDLPTEETTALRMGGMKKRLGAGVSYNLTRHDVISVDHFRDRFYLQTGSAVGTGNNTALQYTHSFRSEAPSLEAGVFWSTYRYRERDFQNQPGMDMSILRYLPGETPTSIPQGYLLPQNFNYFGITLSTNQRYAQDYTRRIQPFASLSLTHHSRDGAGYGSAFGIAGSVWGQDHLMLGVNFSKSSPQAKGSTRELLFSYRRHF